VRSFTLILVLTRTAVVSASGLMTRYLRADCPMECDAGDPWVNVAFGRFSIHPKGVSTGEVRDIALYRTGAAQMHYTIGHCGLDRLVPVVGDLAGEDNEGVAVLAKFRARASEVARPCGHQPSLRPCSGRDSSQMEYFG
jgi:hypothetical protein